MCPLLDKPEQGIELVSEALTQLEFKERFGVVVNCAAHEIFDNVSDALRFIYPFRTLPVFRTLLVLVSSHANRIRGFCLNCRIRGSTSWWRAH